MPKSGQPACSDARGTSQARDRAVVIKATALRGRSPEKLRRNLREIRNTVIYNISCNISNLAQQYY